MAGTTGQKRSLDQSDPAPQPGAASKRPKRTQAPLDEGLAPRNAPSTDVDPGHQPGAQEDTRGAAAPGAASQGGKKRARAGDGPSSSNASQGRAAKRTKASNGQAVASSSNAGTTTANAAAAATSITPLQPEAVRKLRSRSVQPPVQQPRTKTSRSAARALDPTQSPHAQLASNEQLVQKTLDDCLKEHSRKHHEVLRFELVKAKHTSRTCRARAKAGPPVRNMGPPPRPRKDPFSKMKPSEGVAEKVAIHTPNPTNRLRFTKSETEVVRASFKAPAGTQPARKHFAAVPKNILAKSEYELKAVPWMIEEDNERQRTLEQDVSKAFGDNDGRRRDLILHRQAVAAYEKPVMAFLRAVNLDISDVLRFLCEDEEALSAVKPAGRGAALDLKWSRRGQFSEPLLEKESYDLPDPEILSMLGEEALDGDKLAAVCLCCAAIHSTCKVNVKLLAKKIYNDRWQARVHAKTPAFACRICHKTNCDEHGLYDDQFDCMEGVWVAPHVYGLEKLLWVDTFGPIVDLNYAGDNYAGDRLQDADLDLDVFGREEMCSAACFWKVPNESHNVDWTWSSEDDDKLRNMLRTYACNTRGPCLLGLLLGKPCSQVALKAAEILSTLCIPADASTEQMQEAITPSKPAEARRPEDAAKYMRKWLKTKTWTLDQRPTFKPCSHIGPCTAKNCTCVQQNFNCEKSCDCEADCAERFSGCDCARSGKVCSTDSCTCYFLNRECDPDLCGTCGARVLLDPSEDADAHDDENLCQNVAAQLGRPKRVLVGKTNRGVLGGYAGEDIKKDEFITEYTGELINKDESNRRGALYHFSEHEYLFDSASDAVVDATHAGNKARYINHSSDTRFLNCSIRMRLCAGTTRLPIFADRDIKQGEELLFNYGWPDEYLKKMTEPDGTSCFDSVRGPTGERTAGRGPARSTKTGAPIATAKNATRPVDASAENADEGNDAADDGENNEAGNDETEPNTSSTTEDDNEPASSSAPPPAPAPTRRRNRRA